MGKGSSKKLSAKHTAPQHQAKQFVSPRSVLPDAESSDKRISWRFCHADNDGPWSFGKLDGVALTQLMGRLANFESMTVREMFNNGEEPGKHYEVARLPTQEAINRLEDMGLGDMTRISRLRLGGKPRLYGFLLGNVFHMVWWDPEHEIWPSSR